MACKKKAFTVDLLFTQPFVPVIFRNHEFNASSIIKGMKC